MSETVDQAEESQSGGYTSERGPFAINANPTIKPPISREAIDVDKAAAGFAHGPLAEQCGQEAASKAIGEMVKAFVPGTSTTPLFGQGGPNGMSLVHVWFGPNFNEDGRLRREPGPANLGLRARPRPLVGAGPRFTR